MLILLTSDIHMDNKDKNEYRWDIFPWIKEVAASKSIDYLIVGGDILNEKDRYSAALINRLIDNLVDTLRYIKGIYMIKGNHDMIEWSNPYLRWVNNIPNIRFFIKPELIQLGNTNWLFLPWDPDPETNWSSLDNEMKLADHIVGHQSFTGALAEGGKQLSGVSPLVFKNTKAKIWIGDIHSNQRLGPITYIGSPYHITFGDNYLPRCILLDTDSGTETNLYFNTIRRYTVNISNPSDLAKCPFKKGDQIKVRLTLENITDWESHKTQITKYCQEHELVLHQIESVRKDVSTVLEAQKLKLKSLTPKEIYENFCRVAELKGDIAKYGQQIIEEEVK